MSEIHPTAVSGFTSLGDLEFLLDDGSAREFLRHSGVDVASVERNYLRYKPGVSALVGFELSPRDGGEVVSGYVRTFHGDQASTVCEKLLGRKPQDTPFGPGVRLLEGGKSVLVLFPNDGALRGLRFVSRIEKAKRLLLELPGLGPQWRIYGEKKSRLEKVRYKPERRFLCRAYLSAKNPSTGEKRKIDAFLRFFPDERGARIESVARALFDSGMVSVPKPLGSLFSGCAFAEEIVEAPEILPLILEGRADGCELAELASRVHRLQIEGLPVLRMTGVLERASATAEFLRRPAPDLSLELEELLDTLRRSAPSASRRRVLHGDLHLHQVLAQRERLTLVDFERVAAGDPLADVGNLVAHLSLVASKNPACQTEVEAFGEDFVRRYFSVSSEKPGGLRFWIAVGLLEAALLPLRRLEAEWQDSTREAISRAREVLRSAHGSLVSAGAPGFSSKRRRGGVLNDRRGFLRGLESGLLDRLEGIGASWKTVYPGRKKTWPVLLDEGEPSYGLIDPESLRFERAVFEEDDLCSETSDPEELGELVSYRPGRRAVFRKREKGETLYTKVLPRTKAREIGRKLAFLGRVFGAGPRSDSSGREEMEVNRSLGERASLGDRILAFAPRVGSRFAGHLKFSEVEGVSLSRLLLSKGEWRVSRALEKTARALVEFHRVEDEAGELPTPGSHPSFEEWEGWVRRFDPGVVDVFRRAVEILTALRAGVSELSVDGGRLCHGDLHDKNVLLARGRVFLLDLDSLCRAPVERDLGNVCAHFVLRALQRRAPRSWARSQTEVFLDAYEASGGQWRAERLRIEYAETLLRLAGLYLFRRRWRPLCFDLLSEACGPRLEF